MKIDDLPSNVSLLSNVYVIEAQASSKFADKKFMGNVLSPGALKAADKMGIVLNEVQRGVLTDSVRCAYNKGFTFGVMLEDGEATPVNICENNGCPRYGECRKDKSFRDIKYPDYITPPSVHVVNSEWSPLSGTINLTDIKLKKPRKIAKVKPKSKMVYVDLVLGKDWAVKGFWRRLSDGTLTYVRPHLRHRHEGGKVVKTDVYPKYRFKSKAAYEKFRRWYDERLNGHKSRKTDMQTPATSNERPYQLKNVKLLDSPDEIISAPIESRILVNSGPGTGKTYSVIERLKYIVKNDLVNPENVLVLCFSRNAVKVITDRLSAAVSKGEIDSSARDFQICTFDSFATWYLMGTDEHRVLTGIGYDERISQFMGEYAKDPGILNKELKYLIVDEMQDLVGIRAELVKLLLKSFDKENSDRGFLLLGDLCQAIYDYQIESDDETKATDLYRWIETESPFKYGLQEYEIMKDSRHDELTSALLRPLRKAILHDGVEEQDETLQATIGEFQNLGIHPGENDTVAYLFRSNASAFRKSRDLYAEGRDHNFLTGTRRVVLRRELADIFSCYDKDRIDKETFFYLGDLRKINVKDLTGIWTGLLYAADMTDEPGLTVRLDTLKRALSMEKRVGDALIAKNESKITVSTIHKAKGSEYDFVNLVPMDCHGDPDEVKVYYVALTRAKKGLNVQKYKWWDFEPRDATTTRHYTVNKSRTRITGYELGLDGDIDPVGFVDTTIGGDVAERQRYIAENVRRGDKITIRFSNGRHYIVHDGHLIGTMSEYAFINITINFPSGKKYTHHMNDGYSEFTELYVRDVVTVVNRRLDERIDKRYSRSSIWYGIDFCGMAIPTE